MILVKWIKCEDRLPELTNAGWFSDMVLVAFKSAETDSDEIQYRIDNLMLDRYHKEAKFVPFEKYTEGE